MLAIEMIIIISIIVCVQIDCFGLSAFIFLLCFGILSYFNWTSSVNWVKSNYTDLFIYIGYFLLGVIVWMYAKWTLTLIGFSSARKNAIAEYKNNNEIIVPLNSEQIKKALYNKTYRNNYLTIYLNENIRARNYKSKIIAWGIWWPFSLIGTIVDDPIRRLVTWTFDRLCGTFQKLADKIAPDLN
jgi:predicted membrane protein